MLRAEVSKGRVVGRASSDPIGLLARPFVDGSDNVRRDVAGPLRSLAVPVTLRRDWLCYFTASSWAEHAATLEPFRKVLILDQRLGPRRRSMRRIMARRRTAGACGRGLNLPLRRLPARRVTPGPRQAVALV